MKKKEWNQSAENSSPVEKIKDVSNYLRGTLLESLADESTGSVADDDQQLIKFHGMYMQDDRDRRIERMTKKLEPYYSFMIRARIPGGILKAKQWQKMDDIADRFANGTIKLTTRQAIQFHGIIKSELRKTIQEMHQATLDSIAACGDVNRNVMCTAMPALIDKDREVWKYAEEISLKLLPHSRAYHEIWLQEDSGEKVKVASGEKTEIEPLYGKHYLPRKFKIAIATPPHNDTDIFANDVGLIAILRHNKLKGFNVCAGGGLGMTFGMQNTFPRLADVLGYCPKEQVFEIVRHIVEIQRDYGNRSDRKLSRLKYTIEAMGLEQFKAKLEKRCGFHLAPAKPFKFNSNGDVYERMTDHAGKESMTIFVEGGRVKNEDARKLKRALREISEHDFCQFVLTGNQNIMLTDIEPAHRETIVEILKKNGVLINGSELSGLRRNSLACVALNTCPLAMAEGERYLPVLIDKIEPVLHKYKLTQQEITLRMTGCPNGCARAYLGEIGFVGRSVGHYNMYLGASFSGERLNKLFRENINEKTILEELDRLFADFAAHRKKAEAFGDFCIRRGYVKATHEGKNFHL